METELYKRYKDYSKEKIFEILANKTDYQPDAINTATIILKENNWEEEFNETIKKEEEEYNADIAEKAEYYSRVVEFQKDNYFFTIRISDIPRFEAGLINEGIEFYRDNKNIGVQLDNYPTEKYYFKEKDIAKVDKLCINLKLITQPYTDVKPFIKFELKVILIVIVIGLILFFILK